MSLWACTSEYNQNLGQKMWFAESNTQHRNCVRLWVCFYFEMRMDMYVFECDVKNVFKLQNKSVLFYVWFYFWPRPLRSVGNVSYSTHAISRSNGTIIKPLRSFIQPFFSTIRSLPLFRWIFLTFVELSFVLEQFRFWRRDKFPFGLRKFTLAELETLSFWLTMIEEFCTFVVQKNKDGHEVNIQHSVYLPIGIRSVAYDSLAQKNYNNNEKGNMDFNSEILSDVLLMNKSTLMLTDDSLLPESPFSPAVYQCNETASNLWIITWKSAETWFACTKCILHTTHITTST